MVNQRIQVDLLLMDDNSQGSSKWGWAKDCALVATVDHFRLKSNSLADLPHFRWGFFKPESAKRSWLSKHPKLASANLWYLWKTLQIGGLELNLATRLPKCAKSLALRYNAAQKCMSFPFTLYWHTKLAQKLSCAFLKWNQLSLQKRLKNMC